MALTVQKFVFNPFQENTIVVHDGVNCVVIDPGCYERQEQEMLMNYFESNGLVPRAILLTHSHLDHIFGCAFLQSKFEIDTYMHEKDLFTFELAERSAQMYGVPGFVLPATPNKLLQGNETLEFGGIKLRVAFTPGHCTGHVVYISDEDNFVINGDVLFAGSFGRTDLPGGDMEVLKKSIFEVMFALPESMLVYTGHGPETTIGQEKRTNYILQF